MPQEIENKCCGQRRFVTRHTRFQKLCLDPDVLQLAVRNCGDIRNDREDISTRSFRKASYRQYVLNRYEYLGKGNIESVPLVCRTLQWFVSITHLRQEFIWDSILNEDRTCSISTCMNNCK